MTSKAKLPALDFLRAFGEGKDVEWHQRDGEPSGQLAWLVTFLVNGIRERVECLKSDDGNGVNGGPIRTKSEIERLIRVELDELNTLRTIVWQVLQWKVDDPQTKHLITGAMAKGIEMGLVIGGGNAERLRRLITRGEEHTRWSKSGSDQTRKLPKDLRPLEQELKELELSEPKLTRPQRYERVAKQYTGENGQPATGEALRKAIQRKNNRLK